MGVRGETDNDGDYEAMIRRALERSDGLDALYSGYRALRSATVKEHRRRPADILLLGAHLGAELLLFSRALPAYSPWRPRGCAPFPLPGDALAAFDHSLQAGEQQA